MNAPLDPVNKAPKPPVEYLHAVLLRIPEPRWRSMTCYLVGACAHQR